MAVTEPGNSLGNSLSAGFDPAVAALAHQAAAAARFPFTDFGGDGAWLHFLHANGYPPEAYQPLIDLLLPAWHVIALHLRPLWVNAQPADLLDWAPLAGDLDQFIGALRAAPLVGVGHSIGATTTLRLAIQRPERFRALVLLDPVLFPPWMIGLWKTIHRLGLSARLHPLAPAAQRRRRVFASQQVMFENYRTKPVFARLDDTALWAYVRAIAAPRPDGQVGLRYTPEWEAHIYQTISLADAPIWQRLPELRLPVLLLRGAHTDTFWQQTADLFKRRLPAAAVLTLPDSGHLLPLERPAQVAAHISDFLAAIPN